MSNSLSSCFPHRAPLTACLAVALGLTLSAAQAGDMSPAPRTPLAADPARGHTEGLGQSGAPLFAESTLSGNLHEHAFGSDHLSSMTHYVTSCADSGPGSLRDVVNAVGTVSGDSINLYSQLPMACSTITLGSAIHVQQDSLYLVGPGANQLTIDASLNSSAFYHFGAGTLGIGGLTIANGYYVSSSAPAGGCIYSLGSVSMISSVVSNCTVRSVSNSTPARGAGVYTRGDLHLLNSVVTDSLAVATSGANAYGGGAYVKGTFVATYGTVSDNTAIAVGNAHGFGGGVHTMGNVNIAASTISGNKAGFVGGLNLYGATPHTATIVNSTVSGNFATASWGGLWTKTPLTVDSSTIAFNKTLAGGVSAGDGLYTAVASTLKNSIIADNASPGGASDLGGVPGTVVSGNNNLITQSTINPPPGTIPDCPQLEPLANNSGLTLTHALRSSSPAIDQGDAGGALTDQRGAPRGVGAGDDIGSIEWQATDRDERVFVAGFDGLCDQ